MPVRGFWSYTLAETRHEAYGGPGNPDNEKTPINLGLLHGDDRKPRYRSYIGKEWDLLYCPSVLGSKKDDVVNLANDSSVGWFETRWECPPKSTYAGYDYALPVVQRSNGFGVQKKFVYPRKTLSNRWLAAVGQAQGLPVTKDNADQYRNQVSLRVMQTIAMDLAIGSRKGLVHKAGLNAMYSDGHVKFVKVKKNQQFLTYSQVSHEMWLYVTSHP